MVDRPLTRVRVLSPSPNSTARQVAAPEALAPPAVIDTRRPDHEAAANVAAFAELPPYEYYADECRDDSQQQDAVVYPTPEAGRGVATGNDPLRRTFGIRYHDQRTTNSGLKRKYGYGENAGWRPQPQRTEYQQPRNHMDRERLEAVVWRGYQAPPQADYYYPEPRYYPELERVGDAVWESHGHPRQTDQYQPRNAYQETEYIETIPRHWPPQPVRAYYYGPEHAGPARGGVGGTQEAAQPRPEPLRELYVPPEANYNNDPPTEQIARIFGRVMDQVSPPRSVVRRGSLVADAYPANSRSAWRHRCQQVAVRALDYNAEPEHRQNVQAIGKVLFLAPCDDLSFDLV